MWGSAAELDTASSSRQREEARRLRNQKKIDALHRKFFKEWMGYKYIITEAEWKNHAKAITKGEQ